MKAYCENCGTHEASFRPGNDAKTGEPFEDLCCDGCHLVLATVSEREGGYSERSDGVNVPVPPSSGPFTLEQMVAFLCGEAPLDGVWFGELHPGQKGAFWWRKFLRAAAPKDGVNPSDGAKR